MVLTGASSGLGRALLWQLSRLPVRVVAVAREETRLREAVGAPAPWPSQSPEAAARAMLHGIEKDRETIYTSWILPPMLLVHRLLPFTRRWYQALDSRVQRRRWADQAKSESNHER